MIRTIRTALLTFLCFAPPASSEPIIVRSGEHEQFTRLVMLLPDGTTWNLEKNAKTAWIGLSDFDEGFDLSRAFEIIPRTRLNALVATDNRLELQMNCDCAVTGFIEQNGYLVIDISDGLPIEETAQPAPLVEVNPEAETASTAQLDLPDSRFQFGDLLWAGDVPYAEYSNDAEERTAPEPDQPAEISAQAELEQTEATRKNILEAFSAAASRGLVDVSESMPERANSAVVDETNLEIFDTSRHIVDTTEDNANNIRLSTSSDVPSESPRSRVALSGVSCPNPDLLNISSWGTENSFDDQIGESNRNLYSEAGHLNEEVALTRAKLYLHFGFGAEARQILDMIPDVSSQYPELYDLSQYFEYGFVKNPRILHRFPDCDSEFALWGILSPEVFSSSTPADTDAALLALESLPDHLKYFVGQDLGDALLQRGDLEQGTIAMRSYERLPQHRDETVTLNDANVERLRDKTQESQEKLLEVVSNDTAESPMALIQLIDHRLEQDASISQDVQQLAAAYLFELQGTELEPLMLRALILAQAQSALFSGAIENFDKHSDVLDATQKQEVISRLFTSIGTTATDSEFLERYFFNFARLSIWIDELAKLQVGERLFALGFENEAKAVILGLGAQSQSERLSLLSAKLYMRDGMFSETLNALSGLQSSEAIAIRAEALVGLGRNAEARELFSRADEPELSAEAIWLSDDWTDLVSDGDPVFGPVRDVAVQTVPTVSRDRDIVTRASEVVEESSQARDVLQVLLNELQISN